MTTLFYATPNCITKYSQLHPPVGCNYVVIRYEDFTRLFRNSVVTENPQENPTYEFFKILKKNTKKREWLVPLILRISTIGVVKLQQLYCLDFFW